MELYVAQGSSKWDLSTVLCQCCNGFPLKQTWCIDVGLHVWTGRAAAAFVPCVAFQDHLVAHCTIQQSELGGLYVV